MGRLDAQSDEDRDDDAKASGSSRPFASLDEEASTEVQGSESKSLAVREGESDKLVVKVGEDVAGAAAPTNLGATRYVTAGFFAVGIVAAYVFGNLVVAIWSKLASVQAIVNIAPWITYGGEDVRKSWGLAAGAVLGVLALVYLYRRPDVRTYVNEAASELAKVTWPTKKEVTNGTVVVVVASIVAMVYLMLLDRFWGFVTDLVYGA